MPLIKCPMCEKDISPNAVSCSNCGEPIDSKKNTPDDIIMYKVKIVSGDIQRKEVQEKIMNITGYPDFMLNAYLKCMPCELTKCEKYEDAEKLQVDFRELGLDVKIEEYNKTKEWEKTSTEIENGTKKVIRCPNCNSPCTHKISGASKAGSAIIFGVFSLGKLGKTWQCDQCGYRW